MTVAEALAGFVVKASYKDLSDAARKVEVQRSALEPSFSGVGRYVTLGG
jgi:hypothetical protein